MPGVHPLSSGTIEHGLQINFLFLVSDSKEYLVIEREPTQEQIVIEHESAVSKSVALNKGEGRESSKVQTPQRLSNSTRLCGVSIEGTGKGNCHGRYKSTNKPPGGVYFRNFWAGMCRWDPGTLNLYKS